MVPNFRLKPIYFETDAVPTLLWKILLFHLLLDVADLYFESLLCLEKLGEEICLCYWSSSRNICNSRTASQRRTKPVFDEQKELRRSPMRKYYFSIPPLFPTFLSRQRVRFAKLSSDEAVRRCRQHLKSLHSSKIWNILRSF